jgi:DNA helicase-2/ATP-dependent DNA helicase PcrA
VCSSDLIDVSKIKIETFHSFASDNIEENNIVSSNLLRYEIYSYLKETDALNYGDGFLLEKIVPKAENAMRFLKSYEITPNHINLEKVREFIREDGKFEKKELVTYLDHFVKMFERYEEAKAKKGLDYADLLINFLKMNNKPKFKYILVDELQDTNSMEADIALHCAEKFVAVGDKKQAIFGFQGGSTNNFNKFTPAKNFVLSDNFRSTDEILSYSKEYFSTKTKDETSRNDVKNLKNAEGLKGKKPIIINTQKNVAALIASLANELSKTHKEVAIIARTNGQLFEYAKELENRGIDFSSTFLASSKEAKQNIITYLGGLLSNEIGMVKASMFTPFFPITLQDAFELAKKRNLTLQEIYNICPEFKAVRDSIKSMNDLNQIFKEKILPVGIAYGKDYALSCMAMQRACMEAIDLLEDKTLENMSYFLQSTDLLSEEIGAERKIILTNVHKAKGREFSAVIYIPKNPTENENFQDIVVEAILQSNNIQAKEEVEEEHLRIDFVAMTRAKKELWILTNRIADFQNDFAELQEGSVLEEATSHYDDLQKRAFALFLNKEYEKAKDLMETNKSWLKNFVKEHFESLKKISYSAIKTDAQDYFEQRILFLKSDSKESRMGGEVHNIIDKMVKKQEINIDKLDEKIKPFIQNAQQLLAEIKINYPEVVDSEYNFDQVSLSELLGEETDLQITGKIDAIFKNKDNYLVIDWKTDKDETKASEHRQQLELYKRVYSKITSIPLNQITVAIGFIGLRKRINDNQVNYLLDNRPPAKTSFETLKKHIVQIIQWKNNQEIFFENIEKSKSKTVLNRSILEQYAKESAN